MEREGSRALSAFSYRADPVTNRVLCGGPVGDFGVASCLGCGAPDDHARYNSRTTRDLPIPEAPSRIHSIGTMDSAFAKLSRAREHFAALRDETENFRARDTHRFSQEMAPWALDRTVGVVTRRVHIKETPPQSWGLILGDILTNLRAALDHAVYGHAAARQLLTEEQEKRISYPIVLDRAKWPRIRNGLEPLLDPAVMNSIEAIQPFNHQLDPRKAPLVTFNTLVNEDKHRTIRVVSYRHGPAYLDTDLEVVGLDIEPREWTDGGIVARAYLRLPAEMWSYPGDFPVQLRFVIGEGPTMYLPGLDLHWPIVDTMWSCVDIVEKVLADLKDEGC